MIKKGGFSISGFYCPPMDVQPFLTIVYFNIGNLDLSMFGCQGNCKPFRSMGCINQATVTVTLLEEMFMFFQQYGLRLRDAREIRDAWKVM